MHPTNLCKGAWDLKLSLELALIARQKIPHRSYAVPKTVLRSLTGLGYEKMWSTSAFPLTIITKGCILLN